MRRQLIAAATALALAVGSVAPVAIADERHRGYRGYDNHDRYDRRYDDRRGYYQRRDRDDGDAVAAGVVGLVLGLALGSMASQPRDNRARCYDNYQRCGPPQGYYDRGGDYRGEYDDQRSAYERDYGYAPPPQGAYQGGYDPNYDNRRQPQCTRRERQWDRYARQYVTVDVPC